MAIFRVDAEIAEDFDDICSLRLGVAMRDIADMKDHFSRNNVFERCAEGGNQHCRQVGDETDRIIQDHLFAVGQLDDARCGIERCKQHVFGQDFRRGQAVE